MATTLKYSGELVIVRCWCGTRHAIPEDLDRASDRRPDFVVFCPLGHQWVRNGPSKAERRAKELEDQLARERSRRDQAEADARFARRSAAATKGALTKARRRAAHGVCPAPGCKRSFKNLADHVASKHPELVDEVAL